MFNLKNLVLVLIVVLSFVSFSNATIYSGYLTTRDGSLLGTGNWFSDYPHSTISWKIEDMGSHWHYWYGMAVYQKDISHMIIEVSNTFSEKDLFNLDMQYFEKYEIGNYCENNGNPGMPGEMKGLKFDEVSSGTSFIVEFDSLREPVWGDFYAKNGVSGDMINALWNSGFATPDPTCPIHNGPEQGHILVPDTIPEPITALILGLGSLFVIKPIK